MAINGSVSRILTTHLLVNTCTDLCDMWH